MRNTVLLLLFLSGPAQAALSKNDFAYGNEITAEAGKSVIEVSLPEDAYATAKNAQLADLSVFNERDEMVPHSFPARETKTLEHSTAALPLTAFPVLAGKSGEPGFSKIKVSTSADGSIVEIATTGGAKTLRKKISGYLLDASKVEKPIDRFRVTLNAPGSYFVKTVVEGSNDLQAWQLLESGDVLASFEMNGEKLGKNEIPFGDPARFRYYRLSWDSQDERVTLGSLEVLFPVEKENVEEPWRWKPVAGTALPETAGQPPVYRYDAGGFYPVSAMKVEFADQNSLAHLAIEASNAEEGPWSSVGSAAFYSVLKEGSAFTNLQIAFPESHFRYWRLRLVSSPGGVGAHFPSVSFGWRPGALRFLARGAGPFILAYGSAETTNPPVTELLPADWSGAAASGTLKERITLGGADRLVATVKAAPAPWRKYLLAGLLLLGVAFLGTMAVQVRREIPKSEQG